MEVSAIYMVLLWVHQWTLESDWLVGKCTRLNWEGKNVHKGEIIPSGSHVIFGSKKIENI